MSNEKQTLDGIKSDRLKTHGDYADVARISQRLTQVFREEAFLAGLRRGLTKTVNFPDGLTAEGTQLVANERYEYLICETIEMVLHKIGRIVAGDPLFPEHWIDIAGYAQIMYDRLPAIAGHDASKDEEPMEETGNAGLDAALASVMATGVITDPPFTPPGAVHPIRGKPLHDPKSDLYEDVWLSALAISPLYIRISEEQAKVKPGLKAGEYIAVRDGLDVNNWIINPIDSFQLQTAALWNGDWPVDVYKKLPKL